MILTQKCQKQCSVVSNKCSQGCSSWGTNGSTVYGISYVNKRNFTFIRIKSILILTINYYFTKYLKL
jgi:hypothetical protein